MACQQSVSTQNFYLIRKWYSNNATGITKPRTIEEQRENNTSKHQAIFSLDYETWQNLVEAYGDRSPMIEHRETGQQTQVGARGWYN